jgi:hypothetical protein
MTITINAISQGKFIESVKKSIVPLKP